MNEKHQNQVDNLVSNVNKGNYAPKSTELATIYGNRIYKLGFRSGDPKSKLDNIFQVWPTKLKNNRQTLEKSFTNNLNRYNSRAIKTKNKDDTAFDALLRSEEADTSFSKVEKQYLRDVDNIFAAKDKKASHYVSSLKSLEEEYLSSYDLTDKEYATIIGTSKNIGTLIKVLNRSKDQISFLGEKTQFDRANKATVFPIFLLQSSPYGGADAAENYTAPDCSFDPNWGEVGGSGAMGAATGFLGATAYMGYGAAAGSTFGPAGSAVGAASAYAWGGTTGAATEIMQQYDRWVDYTTSQEK